MDFRRCLNDLVFIFAIQKILRCVFLLRKPFVTVRALFYLAEILPRDIPHTKITRFELRKTIQNDCLIKNICFKLYLP